MTDDERKQFQLALGEELAAKEQNIAAAKGIAPRVLAACEEAVAVVRKLREAREAAGGWLS